MSGRAPGKLESFLLRAAAVRAPVEELAAGFRTESGVPVRIQFGGSGTLLANLELSGADLFLAVALLRT